MTIKRKGKRQVHMQWEWTPGLPLCRRINLKNLIPEGERAERLTKDWKLVTCRVCRRWRENT